MFKKGAYGISNPAYHTSGCNYTKGAKESYTVVQACNPNAWAVQAGKSQV